MWAMVIMMMMNVIKMTKSQESEQRQWRQRQRLQWRWWSWQCSPATGERRVTRAKRLFHWNGNHVNISLMFSNVYYSYLSFTKKKQDNQKKAFFLQNSQSSKLWLWSSSFAMKAAIKKSFINLHNNFSSEALVVLFDIYLLPLFEFIFALLCMCVKRDLHHFIIFIYATESRSVCDCFYLTGRM